MFVGQKNNQFNYTPIANNQYITNTGTTGAGIICNGQQVSRSLQNVYDGEISSHVNNIYTNSNENTILANVFCTVNFDITKISSNTAVIIQDNVHKVSWYNPNVSFSDLVKVKPNESLYIAVAGYNDNITGTVNCQCFVYTLATGTSVVEETGEEIPIDETP